MFLFDTEGLLFSVFDIVSIDDRRVEETVHGEAYAEACHPMKTTIKGATYHQLEVVRRGGSWKAMVIFDLWCGGGKRTAKITSKAAVSTVSAVY